MFSQFLDTWIVSEESEVDALVDYLYEQLIGYELKNNSRKTKDTLKIVLLNLYSTYLSDSRLFLRYSRDETFYSNWIRRYVGTSLIEPAFQLVALTAQAAGEGITASPMKKSSIKTSTEFSMSMKFLRTLDRHNEKKHSKSKHRQLD